MEKDIIQINESEYNSILLQAVAVIEEARQSVSRHVATVVSTTHWNIGKLLHERKLESGHRSRVVERLSVDLKERYPQMGVSPRQLWNMKKFYLRYAGGDEKLLQSVALLPWSHNLLLLNKGLSDEDTLYYAQEIIRKGWNRDLLLNALKMKMHENQPAPIGNLFGGLYDFAGQIRTKTIWKDGTLFCRAEYLMKNLSLIEAMPETTFDEIVNKYVEMNVAHPSMEGNGRSTRIWLDLIFKKNLSLCADWSNINKKEYLEAMRESTTDATAIRTLLHGAMTDKINDREIFMKGIDYSYEQLASECDVSRPTIARTVKALQTLGRIRRVGSDKTGHWEVLT